MTSGQRPVFLFDGDCAFCSSCARFIERRIRTGAEILPWQFADLQALGVTQQHAEEAVQWCEPGEIPVSGTPGISRLLRRAQWYWRPLGWGLVTPPISWIAPPLYRLISRNRHRLPGGTAMCALPQAQRDALRGGL
jgi:predicted DCC family thiol-disulfide oxidoreductase YuxK